MPKAPPHLKISLPALVFAGIFFLLPVAFAQTRTTGGTGAPDTQGGNLPARPIGPNDLVAVSVYDAPEQSRTVRVDDDGFIRLPMLKQLVKAQGLMPPQLESAIAKALRDEQIIVDPFVTVTLAEYSNRPAISVVGAVKQPLTFQTTLPITLLEAITRAGGLSPEAGPDILVTRNQVGQDGTSSVLVQRISAKGLIDAADPALNIVLKGGEEIRVPESGKVYVVGNVKMPGAFLVGDGTEATVLKMMALSQGLAPYAAKEAYIYRREGNGSKNEIPIPLNQIMERKAPDVPLLANDILYVPDNKGRRRTIRTLETIMVLGTIATSAIIYAVLR